jgi:hypothetical protein
MAKVEVNARDFLASLQRMVAMNNEYFVQQFESLEERAWLLQGSDVRLLSKLKYYNVNSQLF